MTMTCPTGRDPVLCPICEHTSHLPDDLSTALMRRGMHRLVNSVGEDTDPMVIGEVPALDREQWRKARVPDVPPPWVNEAWELEHAYRQPALDDELRAMWVGDQPPEQVDIDAMNAYRYHRSHPTGPLTRADLLSFIVWTAVAVGVIVAAGWILTHAYHP